MHWRNIVHFNPQLSGVRLQAKGLCETTRQPAAWGKGRSIIQTNSAVLMLSCFWETPVLSSYARLKHLDMWQSERTCRDTGLRCFREARYSEWKTGSGLDRGTGKWEQFLRWTECRGNRISPVCSQENTLNHSLSMHWDLKTKSLSVLFWLYLGRMS